LVARNEALMLNSLSRVTHLSQAANLPLTDFTDIHRKNLWRSVGICENLCRRIPAVEVCDCAFA